MNQRAKIIGFHVLGWALLFSLVAAFVHGFGQSFSRFWALPFLTFVAAYVALFYLNASVLLPALYLRKNYAAYFGLIALLLAVFYFSKPFDRLVLHNASQLPKGNPPPLNNNRPLPPPSPGSSARPPLPGPNGGPPRQGAGPRPQNLDIVSIVLFIAVWAASSVQQILRQWRTSERRAAQAEADKAIAELRFLKAQINPHFLFNTLNNIYSLAIVKSDHTADAVLTLSSILRYVTDEVHQNFVPLQSEIDCARNYIELQKLRLSKKVAVEFLTEGDAEAKKIAPLLFMTFIENAFKYGISNREECAISIRIRAAERSIHFRCRNRILPREEEKEREGLGINNAKKRLGYLYPEKYLLNLDTADGHFTVDLTLIA